MRHADREAKVAVQAELERVRLWRELLVEEAFVREGELHLFVDVAVPALHDGGVVAQLRGAALERAALRDARRKDAERRLVVDDLVEKHEEAEHVHGRAERDLGDGVRAFAARSEANRVLLNADGVAKLALLHRRQRQAQPAGEERHAHRVQQTEAGAPPAAVAHRRRRRQRLEHSRLEHVLQRL